MAPKKSNTSNSSSNKQRKTKSPYTTGTETGHESDEEMYRIKRDRNNQAVKRSRVKSKLRTQQTMERVSHLRNENNILEEKVKTLTKELGFLKELFLAHAGGNVNNLKEIDGIDLEKLLSEETTGTNFLEEMKKKNS